MISLKKAKAVRVTGGTAEARLLCRVMGGVGTMSGSMWLIPIPREARISGRPPRRWADRITRLREYGCAISYIPQEDAQ